jgi:hypothetical protein
MTGDTGWYCADCIGGQYTFHRVYCRRCAMSVGTIGPHTNTIHKPVKEGEVPPLMIGLPSNV